MRLHVVTAEEAGARSLPKKHRVTRRRG